VQNSEPVPAGSRLDNKHTNQIYEVFVEKINFLQELFGGVGGREVQLFEQSVDKAFLKSLIRSDNSAIRMKGLMLVVTLIEVLQKEVLLLYLLYF